MCLCHLTKLERNALGNLVWKVDECRNGKPVNSEGLRALIQSVQMDGKWKNFASKAYIMDNTNVNSVSTIHRGNLIISVV